MNKFFSKKVNTILSVLIIVASLLIVLQTAFSSTMLSAGESSADVAQQTYSVAVEAMAQDAIILTTTEPVETQKPAKVVKPTKPVEPTTAEPTTAEPTVAFATAIPIPTAPAAAASPTAIAAASALSPSTLFAAATATSSPAANTGIASTNSIAIEIANVIILFIFFMS